MPEMSMFQSLSKVYVYIHLGFTVPILPHNIYKKFKVLWPHPTHANFFPFLDHLQSALKISFGVFIFLGPGLCAYDPTPF